LSHLGERVGLLLVSEFTAPSCVFIDVLPPVTRNVGIDEDRGDRALGLAQAAVDALIRVDNHLVVHLINTVHRADVHTRLIFHSDTRFSNYVWQLSRFPLLNFDSETGGQGMVSQKNVKKSVKQPSIVTRKMRFNRTSTITGIAIVGLSVFSSVASADITIGGNRSRGMGGAGLALPIDIGNNYRLNPAFLAFGSKAPAFQWPGLGYKLSGIGVSDIRDILGDVNQGGLDSDKVIELAQQYADRPVTLAVNADFGLRFAGLAIGARGEVGINTRPNEQLRTWAANGGNLANVDAGSRLDTYGYGTQQFEVGYGNSVRSKMGRLAIGFNARKVTSYYAHKFADRDTIQNSNANGVQNGSGIADDFAKSESFGMDLGVMYSPNGMDNLYIGAVIENFIEPKISFPFEAAGGGQPITANGFDPFKRNLSLGVGYVQDKLLLAADVIDLGNRAGRMETRYGAELTLNKSLVFRAGYNSRTAFTYGFSLGGLNIQLGGQAPITLGSVIRF
jgi:hypothetical protein